MRKKKNCDSAITSGLHCNTISPLQRENWWTFSLLCPASLVLVWKVICCRVLTCKVCRIQKTESTHLYNLWASRVILFSPHFLLDFVARSCYFVACAAVAVSMYTHHVIIYYYILYYYIIFSIDLKTQVAEVFIRSFVMSETRHSAVRPAREEILRRKTDCRGRIWFKTNHSRSKSCGCVVYNQHALSFSDQITDVPLLS